jgi:hypothetical protein
VSIAGKAGSNVAAGLRSALNAILQSPSFLYRVELGAPSAADGGKLKYTDFEMASRLAATLWDSVRRAGRHGGQGHLCYRRRLLVQSRRRQM